MPFSIFCYLLSFLLCCVELCRSEANKYTQQELMLMKTQDMGYILQKIQSERNVGTYALNCFLVFIGVLCEYCNNVGFILNGLIFVAEN